MRPRPMLRRKPTRFVACCRDKIIRKGEGGREEERKRYEEGGSERKGKGGEDQDGARKMEKKGRGESDGERRREW
jgi:hypothetical protein